MKTDQYGQMIFDESDLTDLLMQGQDLMLLKNLLVDPTVDLQPISHIVDKLPELMSYNDPSIPVDEFDLELQSQWAMPQSYKDLDIAEHVLNLCNTQEELQRCGEELLLYQEKNLMDLLRYLTYLVDTLKENNLIWGVGRGSSVASYVLYLLGVHRIDSMYYNLDIAEFLR
jgi:DNA polymerase III alpha subunit